MLPVTISVLCPFPTYGGSRANQTEVFLYEGRDEKQDFIKGGGVR